MKNLAIERIQHLSDTLDFVGLSNKDSMDNLTHDINDCFDTMASYWQRGNYEQIVKYANDLPLHCLCDIRICVYYLYSLWSTNQQVGTECIISALTGLLTHKQRPWQIALNKKDNKSQGKIFLNSITMFFRKMLGRLDKMIEILSSEDESSVQIITSIERFTDAINKINPKINNELESLLKHITNHFVSLQVALEEKQEEQERINRIESEQDHSIEDLAIVPQVTFDRVPALDPSIFNPSHPLQLLFKRIHLLHKLIDKGHQLKAAIVLEDIQSELDNFNPLLYFPEYFSSFAELRAKHVSSLEPFFCEQQSYKWKVLHEYFHTDMVAFLALEDTDEARGSSHNEYIPGDYHE